jgi:predicted site-specific integrase-resolvase
MLTKQLSYGKLGGGDSMKLYSIGEFSKKTRKSISTLRKWNTEGKLKPHHVSEGGHRYYSEQQANQILQIQTIQKARKIIGYCRVSSNKQKDDLERQIEHVRMYMIAKCYSFEVISDVGSGINYNKKGLNQLIDRIPSSEVEKVVILYKDRGTRSNRGFDSNRDRVQLQIARQASKQSEEDAKGVVRG